MTRETRIGLLVGLGFIIMFGLVLGWLNDGTRQGAQPVRVAEGTTYSLWPQAPVSNGGGEGRLLAASAGRPAQIKRDLSVPGDLLSKATLPAPGESASQEVPVKPGELVVVRYTRPLEETAGKEAQTPAPDFPAPALPAAPPAPQVRKHTVQDKDSLFKIAKDYYGDGKYYKKLFEANKDVLSSENSLRAGQVLVIPDLPGVTVRGDSPAGPAPSAPAKPVLPTKPGLRQVDLRELPSYLAEAGKDRAAKEPAPAKDVPRPGVRESAKDSPKKDSPAKDTLPRDVLPKDVLTGDLAGGMDPVPGKDVAKTGKDGEAGRSSPAKKYVVRRGDSLMAIARRHMKDDSRSAVQRLYEANKAKLSDPDSLPAGLELVIPAREQEKGA